MIPGYRDSARIVGQMILTDHYADMRLCSACFATFALPVGSINKAIEDGAALSAEFCDECGETIGSEPANSD